MTSAPTDSPREDTARPRGSAGLRARIWLSCLLLGIAGAAAVVWTAAMRLPAEAVYQPGSIPTGAWAAAGAPMVLSLIVAIVLDGGIVGRLRRLRGAVREGDPAALRGVADGWGEIGLIADDLLGGATRMRELERRAAELELARARIERPEGQAPTALAGLDALLDAIEGSIEDARHSAETAERGFVEATSLASGLRELDRLAGELAGNAEAAAAAPLDAHPDAVMQAFEELVHGSGESVDHIAAGMFRVQEIVDQVQRLANRATVIALNVVVDGEAGVSTAFAADLKALAREVRSATDRTLELSRELDGEVRAAASRMHELRGRVASRIEAAAPAGPDNGNERLLRRMREVARDVSARVERVAAAGERASRAAGHVAQRLDEEARPAVERLLGTTDGGGDGRAAGTPTAEPNPASEVAGDNASDARGTPAARPRDGRERA